MIRTATTLCLVLLAVSPALGQPVHDLCANAMPITEGSHDFDNFDAALEGPTVCDPNLNPDVWFLYTASFDGSALISTCNTIGTLTDTTLCVYEGVACPTVTSLVLATDDDSCGATGFNSEVSIAVTAGESYYVQVGGWNGSEGYGTLTISEAETCGDGLDNDSDGLFDCDDPDCAESVACPEQCTDGIDNDTDGLVDCLDEECVGDPGCAPVNNLCSSPLVMDLETLEFSTAYADLDGPDECVWALDADVWFRYDATFTGQLIAEGCFTTPGITRILAYAGAACPSPTDVALGCASISCHPHSPAALLFDVVAGESYLIRVIGDASSSVLGSLTLRIFQAEICDDGFDNDLDGALDCVDPECYGNPICDPYGGETNIVINVDAIDHAEGVIADGPALAEALAGHEQSVLVVNNSVEFVHSFGIFYEPSLEHVWVTCGTYPSGEPLSPAALDILLQAQQQGKNIYLASGDQWGSGLLASPYRFVDGVNEAESTSGGARLTSVDGWDSNVGLDLSDWTDLPYTPDTHNNKTVDQLLPSTPFTDIGIVRAGRVLGADDALDVGDFSVVIAVDTLFGGKTISSSIEFGALDPDLHHDLVGRYLDHFTLPDFRRGDVNDDGLVSLADVLGLAEILFGAESSTWPCADAADTNDDGGVDVSDAVFLAHALFIPGSLVPPEPGSFNCGNDSTADSVSCDQYLACP